jgi:hypothetical protein
MVCMSYLVIIRLHIKWFLHQKEKIYVRSLINNEVCRI